MMKRITLTGGPLDGRTYDVPDTQKTLAAQGGQYRITAKATTWKPARSSSTPRGSRAQEKGQAPTSQNLPLEHA